ncbi:glycosyltransferase family 4 protein [Cohnella sp. REN36]|uniref:glycosyltransferase family 4 protein n=1 Tax=Cohnella sp. REN36 TaxID=2887347 RepID=UPI001D136084|nr:glycosyltransferase [Cohnella sp. REN36]MCC3377286.1 glycosyltransferase [Cohnella sp. REN36]
MRILFSYILPSGGMETLNRLRAEALIRHGVLCHLHYCYPGSGLQNNTSGIPTFVTNDDATIQQLLLAGQYDAIVVSSDFMALERFSRLGFRGKQIYEAQGLGQWHEAVHALTVSAPMLRSHANAVLYPRTAHLTELFQGMFSDIRQFSFDNLLDTERFGYHPVPVHPHPIIGWVGRIEANKNWRDYLHIGYELIRRDPHIQLWMFADASLNHLQEQVAFETMVAQLGLGSSIVRHSNVPYLVMSDYYSIIGDSGGMLLSTSILEGFGYAVAEAMLCRCPVLATDSDGVRGFIAHDATGKFYPHGRIDVATKQALELLTDHALRNRIRQQAQSHTVTNYAPGLYCGHFIRMMNALGVY